MTKPEKLIKLLEEVETLKREIQQDKEQHLIQLLKKKVGNIEPIVSAKGTKWYKMPKSALPKDSDVFCSHFFLTDLCGHYIADKTTYEGRPCKPAWGVDAAYCCTEQVAIDYYEENRHRYISTYIG